MECHRPRTVSSSPAFLSRSFSSSSPKGSGHDKHQPPVQPLDLTVLSRVAQAAACKTCSLSHVTQTQRSARDRPIYRRVVARIASEARNESDTNRSDSATFPASPFSVVGVHAEARTGVSRLSSPVGGSSDPSTRQHTRQLSQQKSNLHRPGDETKSLPSSSSPVGVTRVYKCSEASKIPLGSSAAISSRLPRTNGETTTRLTGRNLVRVPSTGVHGPASPNHLPASRISSSPSEPLSVRPTPRALLASGQITTPPSATTEVPGGSPKRWAAWTNRQSPLPFVSPRNAEFSGSVVITSGGNPGGWSVCTARSNSAETCGALTRAFRRSTRHPLTQTESGGRNSRSKHTTCHNVDSLHMSAPRVRTEDAAGDDPHEAKKRFVDPATYTRLPPEVWVFKYQPPVGLSSSEADTSVVKQRGSAVVDDYEGLGRSTCDSGGIPPSDPGHIGKEIAFPLEYPHGHQQADFLCSSIPTLLRVYHVPTLFSLKNGLSGTSKFPWPPPPSEMKVETLQVAPLGENESPADRADNRDRNTVDCHDVFLPPWQPHISPAEGSPSTPEVAVTLRQPKVLSGTHRSRSRGSAVPSQSPREAEDASRSLSVSSPPASPPNGFLARGLQAVHKGRSQQKWWRGLTQAMDVALSELCRQLKLFAPFHASCVDKLRQSLAAYGEIYDASVAEIFSELQTALLEIYKAEVSLRREARQTSRRLEVLEEKAQEADELRRMLDIHTYLFGLQELDALSVCQAEEEATAADLQWERLLEHLELIHLNRSDAVSAETWVTRSTGEWNDAELSNPSRQIFSCVCPVSATLLPHQTFLRGELDSAGYVKLFRVHLPPGRWTIGLAITCSAPIDVSLLMLLAKRRHCAVNQEEGRRSFRPLPDERGGSQTEVLRDICLSIEKPSVREMSSRSERPAVRRSSPHRNSVAASRLPIPSLDPSLTLLSATPPEWNAFASVYVHPKEPQILHVRTPPGGTPDGGWLLLRVQSALENRRLLERPSENYANALNAVSCLSPQFPDDSLLTPDPNAVSKCAERGRFAAALSEPEKSSAPRTKHTGDSPCFTRVYGGGRASNGSVEKGHEMRRYRGKKTKFSVSVHSVFLHPALATQEREGEESLERRRSSYGLSEKDTERNKGVGENPTESLSRSVSFVPEDQDVALEDTPNVEHEPRGDEEMVRDSNDHSSTLLDPPIRPWSVPTGRIIPRMKCRRNVCVQTVKSSLLRGTLRSLREGPRPPPVPQFCMCEESSSASLPRLSSVENAPLSPQRGPHNSSPYCSPCPSSPLGRPAADSSSSSVPPLRHSPLSTSSSSTFPAPLSAEFSTTLCASCREPAGKNRRFYAPSFPLLKVLLDDTPVPLGDFSSLLYPPSCVHGESSAAATPPGVLSGSRFVRWPPRLLVETAWIVLVHRSRERRFVREGRRAREKQRNACRSSKQTLCSETRGAPSDNPRPESGRKGRRRKPGHRTARRRSPEGRSVQGFSCLDRDSGVSATSIDAAFGSLDSRSRTNCVKRKTASDEETKLEENLERRKGRKAPDQEMCCRPNSGVSALLSCPGGLASEERAREGEGVEKQRLENNRLDIEGEKRGEDQRHFTAFSRAEQQGWDDREGASDREEDSLATFTFTFFLRRFGVAFLAHRALHSFLLSLLFYAPLLTPVSPTQQRDASCRKNTRPCHPSTFDFELGVSSGPENSPFSGPLRKHRTVQEAHLCPSVSPDFSTVSNHHHRQQAELDSRIRGFLPLFSARLFGRLTGLLSASNDTRPFRQSLEDFLCLAVEALLAQIEVDQAACMANQSSAEICENTGPVVCATACNSRLKQHLSPQTSLPSSHLAISSQGQLRTATCGRRKDTLNPDDVSTDKGEGLCLAVSHAAAKQIVDRVFYEDGTKEYRLAALQALDSHRLAALAAVQATRRPALRTRWERGFSVRTRRENLADIGDTEDSDSFAVVEHRDKDGGGSSRIRETERTDAGRRAASSPGRWKASERSDSQASEGEDDAGDSCEKALDTGKMRRRRTRKAPQARRRKDEGWNLLVPTDLLIQALTQQWEVLYIHLQQAMEMVLDSEVRPPVPILSFSAFAVFLRRLDSAKKISEGHQLALYRRTLFAAASRVHPLCSSLPSSSLAALLLHQSHLLAFSLPFPSSPFLALGPEPQPALSEGKPADAGEGAGAGETTGPVSFRGEASLSCFTSAARQRPQSSPRQDQTLPPTASSLCCSASSSRSFRCAASPQMLSSPSYECRLAAFVVDGLVHFLCTEAAELLHEGHSDIRRVCFLKMLPAREAPTDTKQFSESRSVAEGTRVSFAAEDKKKKSSGRPSGLEGLERCRDGDRETAEEMNTGGNVAPTEMRFFSASCANKGKAEGRVERVGREALDRINEWLVSADRYKPLYADIENSTGSEERRDTTSRMDPRLLPGSLVKAFAARPFIKKLDYIDRKEALLAAKELDFAATEKSASAAVLLAKIYPLLRDLLGVFSDSQLPAPSCYTLRSPLYESSLFPGFSQPLRGSCGSSFTPRRGRLSLRTRERTETGRDQNSRLDSNLVNHQDSEALQEILRSVWTGLEKAAVLTVEFMEQARTEYNAHALIRMRHRPSAKEALGELARLYRDQVDRLFILSVGSNAFSKALQNNHVREQLRSLYRQSLDLERQQLELHDALHEVPETGENGDERRQTRDRIRRAEAA
uniref:Uncharacterized protein n=1 Tax=Toxoplasma gondii (strain ATCC 50861 / VEG) TaxID=432359 RepID=A0A0F7USJ8_TOXGV|nr:TPA: hypothetical protein BN1205_103200 [Toxoplasma gondii VEG]